MQNDGDNIEQAVLIAAFEQAADAIVITDTNGRIRYVNPAFTTLTGFKTDEVIGQKPRFLQSGLQSAAAYEQLWDAIQSGGERQTEEVLQGKSFLRMRGQCIRKDGASFQVSATVSPIRDSLGKIAAASLILRDISERGWAKEKIHEEESLFRVMADGCPALMWVTNAEGQCEFINRAYREFFSTTLEQVQGLKWHILLHPDDAPRYLEASNRSVHEQAPLRSQTRARSANGEWRWLATYAEPRFSPDGEFLGQVGLGLDITEPKQVEQALRSSEEMFRQLAENIREVFWIMPPEEDQIPYVSPAFEQVWGRSRESLYKNPYSWVESIHPDDRERARLLLTQQVQGEPVVREYRIRTPEGAEKWIRDRAFPVRDQSGKVIRVVGIAEEITEQKRYETELIHAREAADVANQAKSEFLANMSHEIRTPMNGILGMTELTLDTELDSTQREYLNEVKYSADVLMSVINDILDFSRIEAGKLGLDPVEFSLRDCVGHAMKTLSVRAYEKDIELACSVPPELVDGIVGDSVRLHQIILKSGGERD
jgi:PAS domain S-box-containing protein